MSATLAGQVMPARRVTLVGLAKNTGKTEALTTLAAEMSAQGHSLGITSIGRDGEESDVIRPQIAKPRIHCPAGTLVATTAPLLARCAAPHEVLLETEMRTPLGRVVIGRIERAAEVEIAGPSTSAGIRVAAEAMISLGAENVLIDGSIDRRAASAPGVTDAVVMATGAVLGQEIDEVAEHTGRVLELVDLPPVEDPRLRKLADQVGGDRRDLFVDAAGEVSPLPKRFALTASAADLADLVRKSPERRSFLLGGIVSERFLDALLPSATGHLTRVIATDPTKVFLRTRPPHWYRRKGIRLEALRHTELRAITVNPVAPLSHRLSSDGLRTAIGKLAARVPVFDVRSSAYVEATQSFIARSV